MASPPVGGVGPPTLGPVDVESHRLVVGEGGPKAAGIALDRPDLVAEVRRDGLGRIASARQGQGQAVRGERVVAHRRVANGRPARPGHRLKPTARGRHDPGGDAGR